MHKLQIRSWVVDYTIRAAVVVIGIMLILAAMKAAVDHRSQSYFVPTIDMPARQIEKQLTCLSRNIYWEAANEPFEGKVAVAQVTINRMQSGKFPDTVCGVVHQKTTFYDRVVCQFSWLCENNHLVRPVYKPLYKESEDVAKMVLLEGFRLKGLQDALYYHADYVNPQWKKEKVTKIGRHIFYKDKQ